MTYNVFSGTLNPTQSIQSNKERVVFCATLCRWVRRCCRFGDGRQQRWQQPCKHSKHRRVFGREYDHNTLC